MYVHVYLHIRCIICLQIKYIIERTRADSEDDSKVNGLHSYINLYVRCIVNVFFDNKN